MLVRLDPVAARKPPDDQVVASVAQPLFDAEPGRDALAAAVRLQVSMLGFDSFSYAFCACPRINPHYDRYVFTTLEDPDDWIATYNHGRYLLIDPRFRNLEATGMPLLWDQASVRGQSAAVDRCLDAFDRFGVRSGITFMLHDVAHQSVVCAFNSERPDWDESARQVLSMRLGDLVLFGMAVHEYLMVPALGTRLSEAATSELRLTRAEHEVYALMAQGDGTAAIAARLGKSESAVQKLVDSARARLEAPNRTAAMAAALAGGEVAYPPGASGV